LKDDQQMRVVIAAARQIRDPGLECVENIRFHRAAPLADYFHSLLQLQLKARLHFLFNELHVSFFGFVSEIPFS
jgi:hypothetical protein